MPEHKKLLDVRATAVGGRDGSIATEDGKLTGRLAFPPQLGGDGNGLSPEHLFAAGHAACFATSVKFAAKAAGLTVTNVSVTCTVSVLQEADGAFRLASALAVTAPELPPDRADEVLTRTHGICMYSRALAGHADVTHSFVS
ncbi:MAG: Ohr family peroxiredoxin [Gemmatimonadaceae bacterium]|nr:Ohr family peroxiredoxin [Gemmatimonadaceae bacterium]